jgi:hypothetical protein
MARHGGSLAGSGPGLGAFGSEARHGRYGVMAMLLFSIRFFALFAFW